MARGRPSRVTVYRRLDAAVGELQRLGGLPSPREADSIWSDIWHLEAHHSTALEGNTLVLREVERLLADGQAVGAKPLKDYLEVKGYADAARWVYGQALEPDADCGGDLITVNEIRRVHHTVMTAVWDVARHEHATDAESPGHFRRHDIQPFPGGMTPPAWPDVPADVSTWVDTVNESPLRGDDSIAADQLPEGLARLHNDFECIHPFLDGNGRTGRLALNLILVRLGFPPVVIFKRQRDAYLAALQRADRADYGPLAELLTRAMLDNLNRFIVPNIAGPAQLVPLTSLADKDFSVAALRQAAQRGRLEAVQGTDGIWLSSRHAVQRYREIKHRRRPKATSG